MSKIAKFDGSSADAYAVKNIGPAALYTVTADVYMPAATVTALDPNDSAMWLSLGGSLGDGLFAQNVPPLTFSSNQSSDPATGVMPVDTWFTAGIVATHTSGTVWDCLIKVNGTTLFTDTAVDLGVDASTVMPLTIGGLNARHHPGEVYYIANVAAVW